MRKRPWSAQPMLCRSQGGQRRFGASAARLDEAAQELSRR
jgi:hypothetical protein